MPLKFYYENPNWKFQYTEMIEKFCTVIGYSYVNR